MVGAALTVASLAGQVFAAHKGGQANEANYRLLRSEKEENEAFYNKNVNRDYMETNAAKGLFKRINKDLSDRNKVVESKAATTGGTAEAVIAEKSRNQENYDRSVTNVAENATAHKARAEATYRRTKSGLVGAEMGLNQQKANSAANLASNAAGLAGAAANIAPSVKAPLSAQATTAINTVTNPEANDPYKQKLA